MRPSKPNSRLKQRIADNLEAKPRVLPVCFSGSGEALYKWVSVAAAAAVVLLAAISLDRQPKSERWSGDMHGRVSERGLAQKPEFVQEASLDLIRNANYLIEAEDNGFVDGVSPVPLRKVTWQYVSAAEFRDKLDNAIVQVFIPRQETVLIPADVH